MSCSGHVFHGTKLHCQHEQEHRAPLHLLAGISCWVQCLPQLLAHKVVKSTEQQCSAAPLPLGACH